jgi:hypothetical protein
MPILQNASKYYLISNKSETGFRPDRAYTISRSHRYASTDIRNIVFGPKLKRFKTKIQKYGLNSV